MAPPGVTVTIEDLEVGNSEFIPGDEPQDPTEMVPEGVRLRPMTLVAKPCFPEGDGDVAGKVGCAAGNKITDTAGCGLWPRHDGLTPIGTYKVSVTWYLSTLCADDSATPCRGLEPAPDPEHPVIAEWRVSESFCANTRNYDPKDYDYGVFNCPA